MNKRKIFNDPVYGFIQIPSALCFDLIEHRYFQRLRRIQQLGLSSLVYPGAVHTRFHHALGAMHLVTKALRELKEKGVEITNEEFESACCAILLHDIGHGPFSHSLEHLILPFHHEKISISFINEINKALNGKLDMAIEIFNGTYCKKFLHQLVSGQLDVDRLDYLTRDSFYTGVSEGIVGYDRILQMLNVVNDELVVEEKGIYSIEKFLISRRIMYWQVYLHKTVISAEVMLRKLIVRAKETIETERNDGIFYFLHHNNLDLHTETLERFAEVDDSDILQLIKKALKANDKILQILADGLLNRNLFKTVLLNNDIENEYVDEIRNKVMQKFLIDAKAVNFLIEKNTTENRAYNSRYEKIRILMKNGEIKDITSASDNDFLQKLNKTVVKYYVCFPEI